MALGHLMSLPGDADIHVYADNRAALNTIFDTSLHSSQAISISACSLARTWLSTHRSRIHLHWCPGHMGIELNELVDRDAKDAANHLPLADYKSHTYTLQGVRLTALAEWRLRAGHQFLTGRGPITLSDKLKAKNTLLHLAGGSTVAMARLTRATVNHAPTGEFRSRFFPQEPLYCDCNPLTPTIHTRSHNLFHCPRYTRAPNFQHTIRQAKDPIPHLFDFLEENPHAFMFEHAPSIQ